MSRICGAHECKESAHPNLNVSAKSLRHGLASVKALKEEWRPNVASDLGYTNSRHVAKLSRRESVNPNPIDSRSPSLLRARPSVRYLHGLEQYRVRSRKNACDGTFARRYSAGMQELRKERR